MKGGKRNLYFWYDIFILQITEDEIVQELLTAKKKIPKPDNLRELVNERIESRRNGQSL